MDGSFAFRPRFRGIAYLAMLGGSVIAAAGLVSGQLGVVAALATAGTGVVLGCGYLASPAWRFNVLVSDAGLKVVRGNATVLELGWGDIRQVIASPETNTCYVDGGSPEQSLLVPGEGAGASYDIADKATLVKYILSHVPKERVELVDYLDRFLMRKNAT